MHGGTIVPLAALVAVLSDASPSQPEQRAHHLRPSPLLLSTALDGKETVTKDGRIAKTLLNCVQRAPARPASLPPTATAPLLGLLRAGRWAQRRFVILKHFSVLPACNLQSHGLRSAPPAAGHGAKRHSCSLHAHPALARAAVRDAQAG